MYKWLLIISIVILLPAGILYADSDSGESASGFLTSMPPGMAVLNRPADASEGIDSALSLVWYSQIHAASYNLEVSNTADFMNLLINEAILDDTSFIFTDVEEDTAYYWRVCAVNAAGNGEFSEVWHFSTAADISNIEQENRSLPEQYALLPVYPNPFNPGTTIAYHLPEKAEVLLVIYNSIGQSVCDLVSSPQQAGKYAVQWDGRNRHGIAVSSGIYLCILKAGKRIFTKKMLLIR